MCWLYLCSSSRSSSRSKISSSSSEAAVAVAVGGGGGGVRLNHCLGAMVVVGGGWWCFGGFASDFRFLETDLADLGSGLLN